MSTPGYPQDNPRGEGLCQDPWLIASSDHDSVVPIACAHNHHFWACDFLEPELEREEQEEAARRRGDSLVYQRHVAVQSLVADADGEPEGLLQRSKLSDAALKVDTDHDFLSLCKALMTWNPFPGDPNAMNEETSMMGVKLHNGTDGIFQVLRWRQVLKSLQLEVMDEKIRGSNRAHVYQASKMWKASKISRRVMEYIQDCRQSIYQDS